MPIGIRPVTSFIAVAPGSFHSHTRSYGVVRFQVFTAASMNTVIFNLLFAYVLRAAYRLGVAATLHACIQKAQTSLLAVLTETFRCFTYYLQMNGGIVLSNSHYHHLQNP
jgi:hypothetical protein